MRALVTGASRTGEKRAWRHSSLAMASSGPRSSSGIALMSVTLLFSTLSALATSSSASASRHRRCCRFAAILSCKRTSFCEASCRRIRSFHAADVSRLDLLASELLSPCFTGCTGGKRSGTLAEVRIVSTAAIAPKHDCSQLRPRSALTGARTY